MTSLPEPPTSIPVQLCSRILWASPAPGPCGLGRSLIDLSLVWLPKRPGYGGQTRVLSRNASESPEKKCLRWRTILSLRGIQPPSTGTLATGREETGGPLGKWKDGLTSTGKRVDTRAHSSRPGVSQAPRTASVRPRSAHFHLVPPSIPPPEVSSS